MSHLFFSRLVINNNTEIEMNKSIIIAAVTAALFTSGVYAVTAVPQEGTTVAPAATTAKETCKGKSCKHKMHKHCKKGSKHCKHKTHKAA